MFKSLESSGLVIAAAAAGFETWGSDTAFEQVNDKQATVGFNYLNFDRSSQQRMRSFYCKDRAGDRSDEDSSMVATILSTVLDRLGVVTRCLNTSLLRENVLGCSLLLASASWLSTSSPGGSTRDLSCSTPQEGAIRLPCGGQVIMFLQCCSRIWIIGRGSN